MVERSDGGVTAAANRRAPAGERRRAAGGVSRRGVVVAGLGVVVAGVVGLHRAVPNSPGRMGSLVESFLPWAGAVVVVLLAVALVRRSGVVLVALLLPVAVWVYGFGGLLLPGPEAGRRELVVVQHNVGDENPDPERTARALAAAGADLVALEELVVPALSRVTPDPLQPSGRPAP